MNQTLEKACAICGRKEGKLGFYLGIFAYMHPKCAKTAEKIISTYKTYLSNCTFAEVAKEFLEK